MFAKRNVHKKGVYVVAVHFLLQSQGVTGEFMYKALILGNKQFLSKMIYHEAI